MNTAQSLTADQIRQLLIQKSQEIPSMTKTQQISFQVLARMASGADVAEAIDATCGKGTYDRLAREVWMKARQAAGLDRQPS